MAPLPLNGVMPPPGDDARRSIPTGQAEVIEFDLRRYLKETSTTFAVLDGFSLPNADQDVVTTEDRWRDAVPSPQAYVATDPGQATPVLAALQSGGRFNLPTKLRSKVSKGAWHAVRRGTALILAAGAPTSVGQHLVTQDDDRLRFAIGQRLLDPMGLAPGDRVLLLVNLPGDGILLIPSDHLLPAVEAYVSDSLEGGRAA